MWKNRDLRAELANLCFFNLSSSWRWGKINLEEESIMTLHRTTLALLVLYIVLTIYPIISIASGVAPNRFLTPVSTLVGFTFALLHAGQREGWSRALRLLALVFGVSLLFESVGVATGLVYGPYHYTNKLGPLFLGLVPYLIPVAWFMMSYPSFVIADRLIPAGWKHWQRILSVAAVGGLAMTAWDLVMDPIMVSSGHWVWDVNGAYQGIPLQNFWGWWLTVFITFALYLLISGKAPRTPEAKFDQLAMLSYLVTALGIVIISLVSKSGELALIGFFAMMPWVISGWLNLAKE
jgi:putative membrane protein